MRFPQENCRTIKISERRDLPSAQMISKKQHQAPPAIYKQHLQAPPTICKQHLQPLAICRPHLQAVPIIRKQHLQTALVIPKQHRTALLMRNHRKQHLQAAPIMSKASVASGWAAIADRSIRSSLAGARAPRTAPKMPSKQPKSSKPKQKARSWKKALLPCRNWQQGECRRGNSCTFGHDQRYLNLNTAQIAEQNRTSQPLPSSSHALASADICSTDLGDQSSKLTHEPPAVDSQGICRNWLKRHYCTSRSSCRFAHPPDQFPFPSFFINIIDDVIFLFIF